MSVTNPPRAQVDQKVKVDHIVQEYMDSLLADTFPDVSPPQESVAEQVPSETEAQTLSTEPKIQPIEVNKESTDVKRQVQAAPIVEPKFEPAFESLPQPSKPQVVVKIPSPKIADVNTLAEPELKPLLKVDAQVEVERPYPQAPIWAQSAFDVLLFNVCGLKLAVSMEALGRIIKVEHETNQLIGRPDWFMGAYNESDKHYYVVDTAKFIMPEKDLDLTTQGYSFLIQLQLSDWTLACKEVYHTVRLEPDQVKWRSQEGKRPWLAGTVIEHMCALIHVDALVELLEKESVKK